MVVRLRLSVIEYMCKAMKWDQPITELIVQSIVFLPGFQKGRDIKASLGKGQGAVLAKKGNLRCTRKNFEKMDRISLLLGSIKCFPISFNTFKTL
jgi:hypothetical protein